MFLLLRGESYGGFFFRIFNNALFEGGGSDERSDYSN